MSLESPDTITQLKSTTTQLSQQGISITSGQMSQGYDNSKISNDIGTTNDKLMIKKQMKDGYYPEYSDIIYDENGSAVVGFGDASVNYEILSTGINFTSTNSIAIVSFKVLFIESGYKIFATAINNDLIKIYILKNGKKIKEFLLNPIGASVVDLMFFDYNFFLKDGNGNYYKISNVLNNDALLVSYSGNWNNSYYPYAPSEFFPFTIGSDLLYYNAGQVECIFYKDGLHSDGVGLGNIGRYSRDVLFIKNNNIITLFGSITIGTKETFEYQLELVDKPQFLKAVKNIRTAGLDGTTYKILNDKIFIYYFNHTGSNYEFNIFRKQIGSEISPVLWDSFTLPYEHLNDYYYSYDENIIYFTRRKPVETSKIEIRKYNVTYKTTEIIEFDIGEYVNLKAISPSLVNKSFLLFVNDKEILLTITPNTTTRLGPCLDYNHDTKEVTILTEGIDDSHKGLLVNADYYVDNYGKLTLDVTDQYYGKALRNNRIAWLNQKFIDALDKKEPTFTKNSAFNKNFGTASNTICQGNDSRLSDSRKCNNTFDNATTARTSLSLGTPATHNYGSTANTICQGNDSRLSNSRKCNNTFDNALTARTSLSLGTPATHNYGSTANSIAQGNHVHADNTSSTDVINFPIGTNLIVHGVQYQCTALGGIMNVYRGDGIKKMYFSYMAAGAGSSGFQLTGTWRSRGEIVSDVNGYPCYLVERTV